MSDQCITSHVYVNLKIFHELLELIRIDLSASYSFLCEIGGGVSIDERYERKYLLRT